MSAWRVLYESYEPSQQGTREALTTLGNGYFATRGAAEEAFADDVHYPGTYLAGGYDRASTEIAGHWVENEDLVNLPNWLPLSFRVGDEPWFHVDRIELLDWRLEMDLARGLLVRTMRFRDHAGRETQLTARRLVSMDKQHLAAIEWSLTPIGWSGRITIRGAIDGRVENRGVARYRDLEGRHLHPLGTWRTGAGDVGLVTETRQSRIRVALVQRLAACMPEADVERARRSSVALEDWIDDQITLDVHDGVPVHVEKVVALYTSRDRGISEPAHDAARAVASAPSFAELADAHARAWHHLWRRFDITLEERQPTGIDKTMVLRLHVFHLLQTASPHTVQLDVGVPARGLHGEAYRGHVFWDELFILPSITFRMPEIARTLLMYRYRRLDMARAAAATSGCIGAMYPWQSGSDGREETQELHLNPLSGRWHPDRTHVQRHVNAAIAYNIWHYFQVTQDLEFLSQYGAEMFLEIARFWACLATYDAPSDRFEIRGVMGPDEYHDGYPDADEGGLDNNAYTNFMAAWILCRAEEMLDVLPDRQRDELCEKLALWPEELKRWDHVGRRIRIVFHGDGIISQFEGYDRLHEFDWDGYRARYGNIQRLDRILEAEGDSTNRYKVSKQADVLMIFYLFSAGEIERMFERLDYRFDRSAIPRNIDYYRERTSHGSTLSRVVHAWVLSRCDRRRSWDLFTEALLSDIEDIQGGTTAEGVHLGAMAGTVDLAMQCYTGLEIRDDALWLNPRLPADLNRLTLSIRYREHEVELEITQGLVRIRVSNHVRPVVRIGVVDRLFELAPGEEHEFAVETGIALDDAQQAHTSLQYSGERPDG